MPSRSTETLNGTLLPLTSTTLVLVYTTREDLKRAQIESDCKAPSPKTPMRRPKSFPCRDDAADQAAACLLHTSGKRLRIYEPRNTPGESLD